MQNPARDNNENSGEDSTESGIVGVLNEIVRMKRQRHQNDDSKTVTAAERQKLVESYRNLETLKDTVKGRFFIEYSEGVQTLQEEIVL
jgi:hypothetical protein